MLTLLSRIGLKRITLYTLPYVRQIYTRFHQIGFRENFKIGLNFNWSVGPVGNTSSPRSLRSDFCMREGIALSPVEGYLDSVPAAISAL